MRDVVSVALEQVMIVNAVNPVPDLKRMSPIQVIEMTMINPRTLHETGAEKPDRAAIADLSYAALLKCDARQAKRFSSRYRSGEQSCRRATRSSTRLPEPEMPATRFFVNDDGLIVRGAIRCASAGDCGLTPNRYPLV